MFPMAKEGVVRTIEHEGLMSSDDDWHIVEVEEDRGSTCEVPLYGNSGIDIVTEEKENSDHDHVDVENTHEAVVVDTTPATEAMENRPTTQ